MSASVAVFTFILVYVKQVSILKIVKIQHVINDVSVQCLISTAAPLMVAEVIIRNICTIP